MRSIPGVTVAPSTLPIGLKPFQELVENSSFGIHVAMSGEKIGMDTGVHIR